MSRNVSRKSHVGASPSLAILMVRVDLLHLEAGQGEKKRRREILPRRVSKAGVTPRSGSRQSRAAPRLGSRLAAFHECIGEADDLAQRRRILLQICEMRGRKKQSFVVKFISALS